MDFALTLVESCTEYRVSCLGQNSYLPYLSVKLGNQASTPYKLNGTDTTGKKADTKVSEIRAKAKTSASKTFGSDP